MKFCKDCAHFRTGTDRCVAKAELSEADFVHGRRKWLYIFDAEVLRRDGHACGPDAILFKEKPFPLREIIAAIIIVAFLVSFCFAIKMHIDSRDEPVNPSYGYVE